MGVDLRITLLPAIVTKIEAKFGIFSGDHFEIWAAILEFQVLGCSGWLHWIPLPNKHGYRYHNDMSTSFWAEILAKF